MAGALSSANSVEDLRRLAQRRLPRSVYSFIEGGTEECRTSRANVEAFGDIGFRPRIPHDHKARELSTTVLNRHLAIPLGIAPAGFIRIAHPEGELAVARAANAAGIPIAISTLSSVPIEEITAAAGNVWFQLYMIGGRTGAEIAMDRARRAGCSALVVTVDMAATTGSSDRRIKPAVPDRVNLSATLQYGSEMVRRPRWAVSFLRGGLSLSAPNAPVADGDPPMTVAGGSAALFRHPPTWSDLEWIREQWTGSLVVKGVVDPEDARRATALGANAVSVSNHGGNGLDGGPATLRALPAVVNAVEGQAEVFLDGGVRRGGDVVKAMALGASAVFVGRPYIWALAAGGEPGVTRMIKIFRRGIDATLTLLACPSVQMLNESHLRMPEGKVE